MSDIEFSVDEAVNGYLPLMNELWTRIDLVARACDGQLNLPDPYVREYAYLQFRYMCELIALGCLQLHGDLPLAKKESTKKQWNAEEIMKMLHGGYEHSFPQSVIREHTSNCWNIKANSKPNALTRQEFKKLYLECGSVLHRGSIRSIQASKDVDYQKISYWQNKIVELMNEHIIKRANGAGFYIVSLRTTSGYLECSIFSPKQSGGFDVAIRKMNIFSS